MSHAAGAEQLAYARRHARPRSWRIIVGVAVLCIGIAALVSSFASNYRTWDRMRRQQGVSTALFLADAGVRLVRFGSMTAGGVALLCRRGRMAWRCLCTCLFTSLVHPIVFVAVAWSFTLHAWRDHDAWVAWSMVVGWGQTVAEGALVLVLLALLRHPAVRDVIEQWARGDGQIARSGEPSDPPTAILPVESAP